MLASGLPPATSLDRRVNVRVLVSLNIDSNRLRLGRSTVLTGTVNPAHTGSVKLVVERNGRHLTTKTVSLDGTGYRFSYKPKRTGTYSVSARFGGDNDHLGNTSVARTFKVVE